MSLLGLAIIAAAGIKTIVFFIYLYLYLQYRERFLGYWTLAWGLIALKSAMDPFVAGIQAIPFVIAFHVTLNISVLTLAWGTWDFVGQRLSIRWIYAAIICVLFTISAYLLDWPTYLSIIPTLFMFGLIHIHTGLILLRNLDTKGLGKTITAYAFILNGLHQFDFPFFRATDMAPWGYILDAMLRLIIGIGFLLTYFERTREKLASQEAHFRLLVENAKDIIFRFSLHGDGRVEYISPAVQSITGYSPADFYAEPGLIQRLFFSDAIARLHDLARPGADFNVPLIIRLVRKDQEEIWAEMHAVPICDITGRPVAIEGIIRDVTARKQLEQEIFRLDRLNIVGQMAANIGHEIRNPLTTVRGYLQVMSRKQDLQPYQENFTLLLGELDRANSLISEYLSLSKNRLTDQRSCSLNTIVESLFPLIQADAAATAHIARLELGDTPELPLDEKEMRQLILNLTRNGLEAMAPGKTLTIKTYRDKKAVVLAVHNQGEEIPADALEKLGLPFFTTKENGTGLGLAICYSIANRHRAKIEVATGPQGTAFLVIFPLKK